MRNISKRRGIIIINFRLPHFLNNKFTISNYIIVAFVCNSIIFLLFLLLLQRGVQLFLKNRTRGTLPPRLAKIWLEIEISNYCVTVANAKVSNPCEIYRAKRLQFRYLRGNNRERGSPRAPLQVHGSLKELSARLSTHLTICGCRHDEAREREKERERGHVKIRARIHLDELVTKQSGNHKIHVSYATPPNMARPFLPFSRSLFRCFFSTIFLRLYVSF